MKDTPKFVWTELDFSPQLDEMRVVSVGETRVVSHAEALNLLKTEEYAEGDEILMTIALTKNTEVEMLSFNDSTKILISVLAGGKVYKVRFK